MKCESLKFFHDASNIIIGGQVISDRRIGINYDRTSGILLGLDILKEFAMHVGTDKNTGEYILLMCYQQSINDEYIEALQAHFNIS